MKKSMKTENILDITLERRAVKYGNRIQPNNVLTRESLPTER